MTTRIEVIDAALSSIGARALMVETARGADARIREYRTLLTGLLSTYPWWWATATRPLTRLIGTPASGMTYGFALPADMLGGPRAAYDAAECRVPYHDWTLQAAPTPHTPAELHANVEKIWLKYTRDVPPQFWPGYFYALMVKALAGEYALSVREDGPLSDRIKGEVYGTPGQHGEGGLIGQAKAADSQSRPARTLALGGNPLIDARR